MITKTILTSSALTVLVVAGSWVFQFYGTLSSNQNDWALFGAYFGGVLSPLIAIQALLAFLYTIYQQNKLIIQQQNQIKTTEAESQKHDLVSTIRNIESDIFKTLNRFPINVTYDNNETLAFTGEDVLFNVAFQDYKLAITSISELSSLLDGDNSLPKHHPAILSCGMFAETAGNINQLRLYIRKHDEISKNNIMSKYYKKKYKIPCERLMEKGMLEEAI